MSHDDERRSASLLFRLGGFVAGLWKWSGSRLGRYNPVAPAIIALPAAVVLGLQFIMMGGSSQFSMPDHLSQTQRLERLPMELLEIYGIVFALLYVIRMWRYRVEGDDESSPADTPPNKWPDPRQ